MVAVDDFGEHAISKMLASGRSKRRRRRGREILRFVGWATLASNAIVTAFMLLAPQSGPVVAEHAKIVAILVLTQRLATRAGTAYDSEINALRHAVKIDRITFMTRGQVDDAIRRQVEQLEAIEPDLYRNLGLKP